LDIQKKEVWAYEEAFRIYGIKYKTNNLSLEEVQSVVHKDSREKMKH
jgi:hypothetical protein